MLALAFTARANLVLNGDFDANSPPSGTAPLDWTLTNAAAGSDFFVGAGPRFGAYSAPNSANFGATSSFDDVLTQTLATTPGETYTISFELAHDDTDGANDFSVSFGGDLLLSPVNEASFGYTLYSFDATATSAATVLSFASRENPSWYDLDNVDVEPGSIPEPGSLTLVGTALFGLAALVRRKRKVT